MAKINEDVGQTSVKNDNTDMNKVILERLDRLEKENAELKQSKGDMFKKAKEINKDPRKYSYKMWAGVPVLSYESFRKDPSKDLTYKNQFGEIVSNHYLKLSLANGETEDVEVTDFGKSFTSSEKIEARDQNGDPIMLGDRPKKIQFITPDFGTFLVDLKIVN